jgi:hypothetical protein
LEKRLTYVPTVGAMGAQDQRKTSINSALSYPAARIARIWAAKPTHVAHLLARGSVKMMINI